MFSGGPAARSYRAIRQVSIPGGFPPAVYIKKHKTVVHPGKLCGCLHAFGYAVNGYFLISFL